MKITIEHLRGAHAGRAAELEQDVIRLGRAPDNDVCFDAQRDLDASGHHAEIRVAAGVVTVHDLGSSNGTLVGGRRLPQAALRSGDVVECGAGGPALRVSFVETAVAIPRTQVRGTVPPGVGALTAAAVAERAAAAGAPAPAPAAYAVPLVAVAPGQRQGGRTVSMMISAAAAQASKSQGLGRGTQFLRSVVGQAVTQSTRKFKLALAACAALLVLGGVAVGVLLVRQARGQETARQKLVAQIAVLASSSEHERVQAQAAKDQEREEQKAAREQERAETAKEREELQKRIGNLTKQLAGLQAGGLGSSIAGDNRRAVYLLTAKMGPIEVPVCTGFAIRPSVLATNAHCVQAVRPLIARGATIWAVLNASGTKRFAVTKMGGHPRYRDQTLGYDVGLMKVTGRLPRTVRLASTEELRAVKQGQAMYVYGFPGDLAKPQHPEATITQGIISRVMTPDKLPGKFEDARVLQHTAYVSGGTSGSPIFDANGTVIAVNAGGFRTTQQVTITAANGQTLPVNINMAAPGYNYGMRIDLLS
ncbi:MAG TPA: trypsin-like peptidase domain-containing protein, partial [Polyangia bacterium]